MSKAHATFSASGSAKWFLCAGSIEAERGLPNTGSIYADEGTTAHALAEECLLAGGSAFGWVDTQLPGEATTITHEMATHVQTYIDFVKSKGGTLLVEQRVDFSNVAPGGFGTCDALVIDGDTLHVIDLKYGKGIRVDADNNTQAILYAIGAANSHSWVEFKTIVISIVQPRLDHVSEWTITNDDLAAWGERLRQAAELAVMPNAQRTPGEKQCQWCKAKPTCKALMSFTEKALISQFTDLSPPNPDTLNDEQLSVALSSKKLILSWLDGVESLVFERVLSGQDFPGFKLVEGRSSRSWADEDVATAALVNALGADAFERKLLSVAKAEKALGRENRDLLDELSKKSSGALTLAPASDKRPNAILSEKEFDIIV